MKLELTFREESLIQDSVLTRIRTIEKLIHSWNEYPDVHTPSLIESYTKDLIELKEIETKLLKPLI
jgi:tRNA A-37 threonylcarbamoyl transferase component Bud32